MTHTFLLRRPRAVRLLLVPLAFLLLVASGCDYLGFYTRKQHWGKVYESQPSMKVLKRLAPEDSLLLDGKVVLPDGARRPLLFMAVCNQFRKNEVVAMREIELPADEYSVLLPPCDYDLYLFADLDGNGVFERDELVARTPQDAAVTVGPGSTRDGAVVNGPILTVDFEHPRTVEFRVRVKLRQTSYVYPSLDDEFFDPKYGSAGVYNPAGLMAHTQGFLFGLEDFDERKTTVLFVHGIEGTPRDWKFFSDGLDRSRFQPFFFYYPSGLPIDKLGSVLAQMVESLDKSSRNGGNRIVIVAHSLGGLVSLSALQKLNEGGLPPSLRSFISLSTPYGGNDEALTWLDRMPVVVPVWRDIATGSDFLKQLVAKPFPTGLPFHLFFTFKDTSTFKMGESSDGVVALRSQLEPRVQTLATRLHGFNETHSGLLVSREGRDAFLRLLEDAAPRARAQGTAP